MAELPELEPVLAPLLARFWRFIPGLVGLGLAGSYSQWAGQQTAGGSSGGVIDSILHAIATAPAKVFGGLTGTSSKIHTTTRATISHWALAADTETSHWFDHLNVLTRATYAANLANVNAAAAAIERMAIREHVDTHYRDGTAIKVRAQTALNTATSTATAFHTFRSGYARTHAAQVRLNVRYSHAIDVAIPQQLGRIRTRENAQAKRIAEQGGRIGSLEHGAEKTWEWIRTHPLSLATGAFAGAVAIALQRLGWGVLRCRSWQKLGRRMTCGTATSLLGLLDDGLGGLLGALFTYEAVTNLRSLVEIGQSVENGVATGLHDLLEL